MPIEMVQNFRRRTAHDFLEDLRELAADRDAQRVRTSGSPLAVRALTGDSYALIIKRFKRLHDAIRRLIKDHGALRIRYLFKQRLPALLVRQESQECKIGTRHPGDRKRRRQSRRS